MAVNVSVICSGIYLIKVVVLSIDLNSFGTLEDGSYDISNRSLPFSLKSILRVVRSISLTTMSFSQLVTMNPGGTGRTMLNSYSGCRNIGLLLFVSLMFIIKTC